MADKVEARIAELRRLWDLVPQGPPHNWDFQNFASANALLIIDALQAKLESALRLCQECGKGFMDDDWALERQKMGAQLAESQSENALLWVKITDADAEIASLKAALERATVDEQK